MTMSAKGESKTVTNIFRYQRGDVAGASLTGRWLMAIMLTMALWTLLIPSPAMAAEDVSYDTMNIRVQPEYDDPRVLVVLESVLSDGTKLPTDVDFALSKKMPDITVGMACEVPEGQGHRCKVYDTNDTGDFQDLSYSVDTAKNLFLEYYYDPFKGSAEAEKGNKTFTYEFKALAPIKQLDIQVQEPLKGTDYKVEPESKNVSEDQEGFKYHTYSFSDVKPDDVMTFNVSYTKTDKEPSIQKNAQPVNNEEAAGSGEAGNPNTVRWFMFGIVLLVVSGGLAMYWRSQTVATAEVEARQKARPKPKGAKGSKGAKSKSNAKSKKSKFCSECGSKVDGDNKFCPDCGSEIG